MSVVGGKEKKGNEGKRRGKGERGWREEREKWRGGEGGSDKRLLGVLGGGMGGGGEGGVLFWGERE